MINEVKEAQLFLFAINIQLLIEHSHFVFKKRKAVNVYLKSFEVKDG